jgi:dUTPase
MDILAESDLLSAVENETFIINGSKESCEGIKYDFVLNNIVLTTDARYPINLDSHSENAIIKPGEIAFVMTKESLNLPDDIYCQLSTKRKLSLDGIIILGGLIIDPNYKGKLIFGLHNISSRNYPLIPGKKLVAGVFFRVNKVSDKIPDSIISFPDDLVKLVVDTKPNSIVSINSAINDLRIELNGIKNQLVQDNEWKKDFKEGLNAIENLVNRISEKLDKEIDERKDSVAKLRLQTAVIKGIGVVLSAIFGGGLISLIVLYIAKILHLS